ncbi:N-acetyltransferase O1 (Establishment of cohesion protein 1) [Orbilia oligospora]|uniref:N-acetyltransferase O1 (Establishment of cohesion protein 1) n=1 Tax=Orbilia oligospora TaxID=2813651 RepID=A0A8H8URU3_ORBOL|nr:N-acetyltransferase O1 (Establishment of cohesion protein 1) [Orbilia oligospora]
MFSSTSRIRKRPVVTYSKKSRTYLGSSNSIDDINDHPEHDFKRVRISEPKYENEDTTSIKSDNSGSLEITEPESGAEATEDEQEDSDLDDDKKSIPLVSSSQADSEAQALKGDTTSSSTTRITGFTISTRRKPLFKRHITKKTSDTQSSCSSLSSTPSSTQSSITIISSTTVKPPKQKLVQMQIDLDGIGAPKISCKECGMQYVPSADEDAKLHKRYHAQVVEGLEFGNTRGKVVWEGRMENRDTKKRRDSSSGKKDVGKVGSTATGTTTGEKENLIPITRFFASGRGDKTANGKKVVPLVERGPVPSTTSATCHVVEISRRSTPTEKKKAMEFLRFANRELSAQEVADGVLWGSSAPGDGEIEKGEQYKIYLYLEGTKCVGLCLAEKIKEAQWATTKEGGASISCSLDISETKRPALLGISRIWTCPKHRRNGVASRLVSSAVESFVYGMKVEARMVAFSQPTDSGAWFALGWVAGQMSVENASGEDATEKGFLVYLDGV